MLLSCTICTGEQQLHFSTLCFIKMDIFHCLALLYHSARMLTHGNHVICAFVTGLTQLSHPLYSPLEVFQNHHVFMQLHPLYLSFFSLLNFHFIHEGYTRPNMELPLPVKNVFPLLVFFFLILISVLLSLSPQPL